MNDAELEQATRELNAAVNEAVHYMNDRSDFFIVNVGAFEIRFELAKLGKPQAEAKHKQEAEEGGAKLAVTRTWTHFARGCAMRKLKRSECVVLPLVLKRKWYDMIECGEKKIEYRRAGYWLDRVYNWFNKSIRGGLVPVVEFRHGYAKDARRMAFVCGWLWNRRERQFIYCTPPYAWLNRNWPIQHPELGETKIERIAIFIGERVTLAEGGK